MKFFLIVVLIVLVGSSLQFPLDEPGQTGHRDPGDFTGTFEIQWNPGIRVSIERGWERNGRVPVVLSFGDLEVSLSVKAGNMTAAAGIETGISEMLSGDINLPFTIYEQNPARTRMRLSDESMPVILKINREKTQAAIYIGNSRLKLNPIRVTSSEIVPGELVELTFTGLDVYAYKRFIFKNPGKTIHALPLHPAPGTLEPEFNKNNVWAIKLDIKPEKGRFINEGGIK